MKVSLNKTMIDLIKYIFTDFDLFFIYRKLLVIFCTVYTAIRITQSLWRWLEYFYTPEKTRKLMRGYLAVQLLRVRWVKFWREYLQIVLLCGIILLLIHLHKYIGNG